MKKLRLFALTALIMLAQQSFAQSSAIVRQYIDRFKDAAIAEMQRTGVPAAITLAQGIHESSAGQSELVQASNNHFGIKCKGEWTGPTVSHDDDAKGECFRKYDDPIQSYKDHSDFLKNRPYYASLFKLDPTDYEGWAYGLKKAGYATNPKYAQILIKIIRDYNLQDFTLIALGKKAPNSDNSNATVLADKRSNDAYSKSHYNKFPSGEFKINDTRVVFVPKGTSFLAVAEQYGVSLPRLFENNDMQPQDIASTDQVVYLERKRKSGSAATHMVIAGESLWEIAQAEGIRLENLLAYNFLKENMQPESGQVLYMQKQAPVQPKLIKAFTASATRKSYVQNAVATYMVHVVKAKETAYSIARKYDISVDDLLRWNNLATTELTIGQELHINKRLLDDAN